MEFLLPQSLMAKSHMPKVVKELPHKVRLLKAVNYFHQSSPSQIFDRVLNTPLRLDVMKNYQENTFDNLSFSFRLKVWTFFKPFHVTFPFTNDSSPSRVFQNEYIMEHLWAIAFSVSLYWKVALGFVVFVRLSFRHKTTEVHLERPTVADMKLWNISRF